MKRSPALLLAGVVAVWMWSASAGDGGPFQLDRPASCVAGACTVTLHYDVAQLQGQATIEIEWDHPGPPEAGFVARARLSCSPQEPGACTARSPVYRREGRTFVVTRAIDAAGVQEVGSQPLEVEAPGEGAG